MDIINNFNKFISQLPFVAIFAAISCDPKPPEAWTKLYNNLFFRFIFIYIVVYQTNNNNMKQALIITSTLILFFYIISNKKEKKELLSNNFNVGNIKHCCDYV